MKALESTGLRWLGNRLEALDQRRLPDHEEWILIEGPEQMARLIHSLAIRGAPLIGVAAACSLAKHADSGASENELRMAGATLREARPTAVNLAWAVDRMLGCVGRPPDDWLREAARIFDEDVAMCDAMANHGTPLVPDGGAVITHCNAGGLATAGIGTALGVLFRAHEQGKRFHVFVDETRPLLQGARLTAWELGRRGIPHTLICDSVAASILQAGRVQAAFVGADRIAANGDFANKIGTYGLAIAAKHHGVAFYAVAPWSTVDLRCASGRDIPIELRDEAEVRGVSGSFGAIRWAPEASAAFNPAFDVTPAELVTALVLDRGVILRDTLSGHPFGSCATLRKL